MPFPTSCGPRLGELGLLGSRRRSEIRRRGQGITSPIPSARWRRIGRGLGLDRAELRRRSPNLCVNQIKAERDAGGQKAGHRRSWFRGNTRRGWPCRRRGGGGRLDPWWGCNCAPEKRNGRCGLNAPRLNTAASGYPLNHPTRGPDGRHAGRLCKDRPRNRLRQRGRSGRPFIVERNDERVLLDLDRIIDKLGMRGLETRRSWSSGCRVPSRTAGARKDAGSAF